MLHAARDFSKCVYAGLLGMRTLREAKLPIFVFVDYSTMGYKFRPLTSIQTSMVHFALEA